MASNPVFNRINTQIDKGQFAHFRDGPQGGQPRRGQVSQSQGGPQVYPQQSMGGMTPGRATDNMSAEQLQEMYNRQAAGPTQTGRLTLDDVVMKSLGLFAVMLAFAVAGWLFVSSRPDLGMPVWIGGMVVMLGLGFAIALKKTISVPLIVLYAVVEGVFVGAISQFYNNAFAPGLVSTAVIATLCVFIGMFAGFKFGIIRVTSRSRKIFGLMLMGYVLFSIANVVAAFMGVGSGWGFGGNGPLGIGISIFAVGLASYSLAVDFDSIQRAVAAQVPEKYSWLLAHGLIVSLVWLYLEILRLLARMQRN